MSAQVMFFGSHSPINDHRFKLTSFDPYEYMGRSDHWSLTDFAFWGLNGYVKTRALSASAAGLDRLYRERNPQYISMLDAFVDLHRDFDLLVMHSWNFIHPEILRGPLRNVCKVLGLGDDPFTTYRTSIPYLWGFDKAYYTSPGYIDGLSSRAAIARWTSIPVRWFPLSLVAHPHPPDTSDSFFTERELDVIYVGSAGGTKVDRLAYLKRALGSRLQVYGRWPLHGTAGMVRKAFGKTYFPGRVKPISERQKTHLYWQTRIGINMHLSEAAYETGNARMYELPAHGLLQIADKAAADTHSLVFAPETEAIYYSDLDEAVDLVRYYLDDDVARGKIAKAGFQRYWSDYEHKQNMASMLSWALDWLTTDT